MKLKNVLSVLSEDQLYISDVSLLDTVNCDDLSLDSREISDGGVFFALKGYESDGRDYIAKAIDNGAVAIVYELIDVSEAQLSYLSSVNIVCVGVANLRDYVSFIAGQFFGHPSRDLQIYGITGTNGKTSCAFVLAQTFNLLNFQTAFMGTIGVGSPDQLETTSHTTLDAISLQRYLSRLLADGFSHVCMEVSSHALDQGRVANVEFYAVLYTNLSQDHLDYHETMSAYAAAKKQLFTAFDPTLAIINCDDDFGRALIDETNAEFIVCYSQNDQSVNAADVFVEEIEASDKGLSISFATESLEFEIDSPLIGLVNVPNINLIVATLLSLGVEINQIQSSLNASIAAPGRMELYVQSGKPMVVVDYAHTPDALKLAIESCRAHCLGKVWVVFGCGGDRDVLKRPIMGGIAEKFADEVVLTSDNPRSEDPMQIITSVADGMASTPIVIEDRSTAIAYAIESAANNDLILVAGKGHEVGQIVGDDVLSYSDRTWVKECLEVAA